MSKKLIYKRVIFEIELSLGKQTKIYPKHYYGKHIYSDIAEGAVIENLSFDEVCDKFHYTTVPSGRFSKWVYGVSGVPTGEKFCEMWVDDGFSISIHNKNLVSFKIITTYENDTSNRTLEYLMRNLSADEMIEYLKDNGLNVCPIAR